MASSSDQLPIAFDLASARAIAEVVQKFRPIRRDLRARAGPSAQLPDSAFVLVLITGTYAGAGKYRGTIFGSIFSGSFRSSVNLSLADLGTLPAGDNCVIANLAELGGSGWNLTGGSPAVNYLFGIVDGVDSDTGRPVVWVWCPGFGCAG